MPSKFTSDESVEDAAECARLLGVRHEVIPIVPGVDALHEIAVPIAHVHGEVLRERVPRYCVLLVARENRDRARRPRHHTERKGPLLGEPRDLRSHDLGAGRGAERVADIQFGAEDPVALHILVAGIEGRRHAAGKCAAVDAVTDDIGVRAFAADAAAGIEAGTGKRRLCGPDRAWRAGIEGVADGGLRR